MDMLFTIVLLSFAFSFSAQAQQSEQMVSPGNLVGRKFSGTYNHPTSGVNTGIALEVKAVDGNRVQVSFGRYRGPCFGTVPGEGTLDGKTLDISLTGDRAGCEARIRASISDNGDSLNGDITVAGATIPIRLSR